MSAVALWLPPRLFSVSGVAHRATALFGSQENIPITQVVEVLEGEAIAYRINPDNGQVLVAENQLGKARILLAAKELLPLSHWL